jgi:hypothetical protein
MVWTLEEIQDNCLCDYFSRKKFMQCGQSILNISCYILKQLHGEFCCTEKVLVNGLGLGGLAQHRRGPAALKKKEKKIFPHQK